MKKKTIQIFLLFLQILQKYHNDMTIIVKTKWGVSMFHLVLYKRFNYLTKRLRFWWFSGRNGTTINSNHVLLICLCNDFFKICWKIYLFIFYNFIFIPFSSLGRVNITKRLKKNRYICSSNFSFFFSFFQKLCPTTKVVLERTKMRTFPVMWFQQRVIHQTISAGLKKVP